jgi:hypothetical protein
MVDAANAQDAMASRKLEAADIVEPTLSEMGICGEDMVLEKVG